MNLQRLPSTVKLKNAKPFLKQQIIAISALSLVSAASFAQTGFDFGLKGMVQTAALINLKDQAAGPEIDYKQKVYAGGGVSAGYSFTKRIGAEIDILYSPQGQDYKGVVLKIPTTDKGAFCNEVKRLAIANNIPFSGNYTASVELGYIKIPVLFRFNGKNTKRVFLSYFIGPQFDVLSSAKIKVNGQTASLSSYNLDTKDVYKKTTVDGVLGLGIGIHLTKCLVLGVHLRLDYGFGDAENKSASYPSPTGGSNGRANFYTAGRAYNTNTTGGGLISLSYKLLKKEQETKKKGKKGKSDDGNDDEDEMKTRTKTKTKTTTTTTPAPDTTK